MKRIFMLVSVVICGVLFIGAVNQPAPVSPTKSFYVNDYANVLIREHREEISALAAELYETTGVQAVILAVKDLSGLTPADYADAVISRWEIGGTMQNGILLLYDHQNQQIFLFPGKGLSGALTLDTPLPLLQESTAIYYNGRNPSVDLLNLYKAALLEIYTGLGVPLTGDLAARLEETTGGVPKFSLLLIAVALVALFRSLRVSRKYRRKYLHRHQSRRRVFSSARKDDEAANRTDNPGKVRREGFIIHREPEDDDGGDL